MSSKIIFLIGPAACGKTELGNYLENHIKAKFIDADDYHSEYNKLKMSSGEPLTDEDRYPWLLSVREAILNTLKCNIKLVVVACSALKQSYRNILSIANITGNHEYFMYLQADRGLLVQRITNRKNHFMPECLIQSQLDTFEFPPAEQSNFFILQAGEKVENLASNIIQIIE